MLSGAEEGAQGAPFGSYKLAAVRLAEAVRLASRARQRTTDSENDLVLELSGAVNRFLRESGIALAFQGEGRGGQERMGDVARAVAAASALRLLLEERSTP